MRLLVQRSLNSKVEVEGKITGSIDFGLVVLVGFEEHDTEKDIDYLVKKVVNLRIFDDDEGIMNKSLLDVNGKILSVSQFTLYADTKKGNRPSYIRAMKQEKAKEYYHLFNEKLKQYCKVEEGIFREKMKVSITNDGPITILLESR